MPKVYFSPSDQVNNTYAWGNTTEGEQMRQLARICHEVAIRCGLEALYGVNGMKAQTAESNSWKADLHVPLHTNAFNESVMGTRMFAYDLKGDGYRACQCVFKYLAPLTPGTSENIKASPKLYEVKNANCPTCYIESEFHDTKMGAQWIIEHKQDLAEAIVHGICDYFDVKYVAAASSAPVVEVPEPEAPKTDPVPAPKPTTKIVRLTADTPIYKSVPVSTDRITVGGAYTIVEEQNGYGLLKAYASGRNGWVKL